MMVSMHERKCLKLERILNVFIDIRKTCTNRCNSTGWRWAETSTAKTCRPTRHASDEFELVSTLVACWRVAVEPVGCRRCGECCQTHGSSCCCFGASDRDVASRLDRFPADCNVSHDDCPLLLCLHSCSEKCENYSVKFNFIIINFKQ